MAGNELANVRRNLVKIPVDLSRGSPVSAARAVRAGVRALIYTQLLRAEQEELSRMVDDGCVLLRGEPKIKLLFPLAITFEPDKKETLLQTLSELIEILEADALEAAQEILQAMEVRKRDTLERGKSELEQGEHDAARATLGDLVSEFNADSELAIEVGDSFLAAGLYEDALQHLTAAAKLHPGSAHVFNRIGIALRKMDRLDAAEKSLQHALSIEDKDPNLYFNLGRVYFDWKKWAECRDSANAALGLDPGFIEASRLASYCERMLKDEGSSCASY